MPQLPTTFKPGYRRLKSKPHKPRAIPTNSTRWKKIRLAILAREPLCRPCKDEGRTTAATQIDHIDGNAANNAANNLQSICKPCHDRKSALEHGFQVRDN